MRRQLIPDFAAFGTLPPAAVRVQAATYGLESDGPYCAIRARPTPDCSVRALECQLEVADGAGPRRGLAALLDGDLAGFVLAPGEKVHGEVFNVGAAEEHSILDNARLVLDLLGKPHDLITFVPDRRGHVRRHAVNSNKLSETLGWEPRVHFDQGLERTVNWYRDNDWWWEPIRSGAYREYYERQYGRALR